MLSQVIAKNLPWKTFKFTWNNYTEDDVKKLQRLEVSYITFGREHAPETGTPHLQGFVIWKEPVRFNCLKKMWPLVHWKPEKASDAMNYSFKEDNDPFIKDNRRQGSRRDLDAVYDALEAKKT